MTRLLGWLLAGQAVRYAVWCGVRGVPTTCPPRVFVDLARGDKQVARLRMLRDVAEGVREAAGQAAWRASADRKDAQRFADFSLRRQLMEGDAGQGELHWSDRTREAAA